MVSVTVWKIVGAKLSSAVAVPRVVRSSRLAKTFTKSDPQSGDPLLTVSRSLHLHRLNKPAQFTGIATQGKKLSVDTLTLKYLPSPDGCLRLAFVVRKKCGNAVFRNRVRRILREEFYGRLDDFPTPWWGILQFFGKAGQTEDSAIHAQAKELVEKMTRQVI